jgi:hypothetical protein
MHGALSYLCTILASLDPAMFYCEPEPYYRWWVSVAVTPVIVAGGGVYQEMTRHHRHLLYPQTPSPLQPGALLPSLISVLFLSQTCSLIPRVLVPTPMGQEDDLGKFDRPPKFGGRPEIVHSARPASREDEDACLLTLFRRALIECTEILRMPGSPDLTSVPGELLRLIANGRLKVD